MHVDLPKDKLYYSIGELAKALDVNASLIRFWEKEFDLKSLAIALGIILKL